MWMPTPPDSYQSFLVVPMTWSSFVLKIQLENPSNVDEFA